MRPAGGGGAAVRPRRGRAPGAPGRREASQPPPAAAAAAGHATRNPLHSRSGRTPPRSPRRQPHPAPAAPPPTGQPLRLEPPVGSSEAVVTAGVATKWPMTFEEVFESFALGVISIADSWLVTIYLCRKANISTQTVSTAVLFMFAFFFPASLGVCGHGPLGHTLLRQLLSPLRL